MSNDETRQRFAATASRLAVLGDSRVAGLRARIDRLVPLAGDEIALDAGTGTGPLAFALAPLVREVVAVDLVEEMLEQARARASAFPNVRFLVGDALELPLADGSVDLAASARTLHHLSEPGRAIGELVRVTRAGGRVLVVDQLAPEDPPAAERYERIERMRDPSHRRTLADAELRGLLADHGLTLERAEVDAEERDLDVFLDLAGCEGAAREAVVAYVTRLVEQEDPVGVDLRRDGAGFRFTGRAGWYLARKPGGREPL